MRITDFEGGFLFGPKTFAEVTGRVKLWAGKNRAEDWQDLCRERRGCPLCGEHDSLPLFLAPGGAYERCLVCGMVYVPNVPSEKALDAFYLEAPEPQAWAAKVQGNN